MGKDRLRPAQRERQQRVYDDIEREHKRTKALLVGKAESILTEAVRPADRQIIDSNVCQCVGGPEFYRFRDVDGRDRCTSCNRVARTTPKAPSDGEAA